jgi:hypothetical protein
VEAAPIHSHTWELDLEWTGVECKNLWVYLLFAVGQHPPFLGRSGVHRSKNIHGGRTQKIVVRRLYVAIQSPCDKKTVAAIS